MLEKWISSLFLHAEESKRRKERNQKKKKRERIGTRDWREISVTYQSTATVCDFILNIVRTKRLFKLLL